MVLLHRGTYVENMLCGNVAISLFDYIVNHYYILVKVLPLRQARWYRVGPSRSSQPRA